MSDTNKKAGAGRFVSAVQQKASVAVFGFFQHESQIGKAVLMAMNYFQRLGRICLVNYFQAENKTIGEKNNNW